MASFSRRYAVPLAVFGLLALTYALNTDADDNGSPTQPVPAAAPKGKDEKVGDTAITVKTSYSTVDVYESLNSDRRFYVAPHFNFLLVEPDHKVIARPTRTSDKGAVPVQMLLEMVHPEIRVELLNKLSQATGQDLNITDIRNLRVDSVRVDVYSDEDRQTYGLKPFVLNNPVPGAEKLAINLIVDAQKAAQFVQDVNDGNITFQVDYSFNRVTLDYRVEMLRASLLMDTQQMRDLAQKGAEIMTAKQMAEAAANVKREIESKVIEGMGKIESQSLSIQQLVELFNVGKTWEIDVEQLKSLDERLRKQFDLNVDAGKFQPFRYQKKVIETLAKESDVANKKKAYFDLYRQEKQSMSVSAGLKIGPFGASTNNSKEFEEKMAQGNMADDQFREHLKTYHGAEYTTEMVLERGVQVYDVQKVRALGETRIVSTTIKPTVGVGLQNVTLAPSTAGARAAVQRYQSLYEELQALKNTVKTNAEESKQLRGDLAVTLTKLVNAADELQKTFVRYGDKVQLLTPRGNVAAVSGGKDAVGTGIDVGPPPPQNGGYFVPKRLPEPK